MGCNCRKDKNKKLINKINIIMKKNVIYKLKKGAFAGATYFRFNNDKYYIGSVSQQQFENLYKNGFEAVELIENKPTYTNDKKKKSKK
jgi:hypothetical protein